MHKYLVMTIYNVKSNIMDYHLEKLTSLRSVRKEFDETRMKKIA